MLAVAYTVAFLLLQICLVTTSRHPGPQILTYEVVAEYPHDHDAFTQGLEYDRVCNDTAQECLDVFWESTGMYGRSSVRQVSVMSGEVLAKTMMHASHFGEGLTKMNNTIYQIIWKSGKGFMYNVPDLTLKGTFKTELNDGWGLTNDGQYLIATDSSHTIFWIDPITFKTVKSLVAMDGNRELTWLNELEYINGELWANVWQSDCIARICPTTGLVTHWVLMHGLKETLLQRATTDKSKFDVLNGIAWDKIGQRLFVTGKQWPTVFEVVVKEFPLNEVPNLHKVRSKCWPMG